MRAAASSPPPSRQLQWLCHRSSASSHEGGVFRDWEVSLQVSMLIRRALLISNHAREIDVDSSASLGRAFHGPLGYGFIISAACSSGRPPPSAPMSDSNLSCCNASSLPVVPASVGIKPSHSAAPHPRPTFLKMSGFLQASLSFY